MKKLILFFIFTATTILCHAAPLKVVSILYDFTPIDKYIVLKIITTTHRGLEIYNVLVDKGRCGTEFTIPPRLGYMAVIYVKTTCSDVREVIVNTNYGAFLFDIIPVR